MAFRVQAEVRQHRVRPSHLAGECRIESGPWQQRGRPPAYAVERVLKVEFQQDFAPTRVSVHPSAHGVDRDLRPTAGTATPSCAGKKSSRACAADVVHQTFCQPGAGKLRQKGTGLTPP